MHDSIYIYTYETGIFSQIKKFKHNGKAVLIKLTQFRPILQLNRNHSIDLNWFLFDRNFGLLAQRKKLTDFLEFFD